MQSGCSWFCFALTVFALSAQPPRRVAFLGTSITCGAGVTQPFPPLVRAGLERRLQTKIETYDLCFGGAHSFTTLLLLKHTALPWKPDLVVVETGALDGFAPELSKPAIERIFHELASAGIPAVFLARETRCSEENSRPVILQLGKSYGYPVADVNTSNLPDGCHPSNMGHAQIADALIKAVESTNKLKTPRIPAPLKNAKFQSAAEARIDGPNEPTPLTFFKETGAALKLPAGTSESRYKFSGPIAAVLFRLGHTPKAMEYQIDSGPWRKVTIQPGWFLNYYFETNISPGTHELGLRLHGGLEGVILDGLELDGR